MGGESGKFVGRGDEREGGRGCDFSGHGFGETGLCVQTRPDGRSPLSQLEEIGQSGFDAGDVLGELGHVAGEFLTEGQRGGVLEVGAPDFNDGGEGVGFLGETSMEGSKVGEE